jgi:hypothetical protein
MGLVAGLSPRRPWFDPRSVHVGFVLNKVALRQVFPRVLRFSACQFHSTGALLHGKMEKLIIFITGVHKKLQGCGALHHKKIPGTVRCSKTLVSTSYLEHCISVEWRKATPKFARQHTDFGTRNSKAEPNVIIRDSCLYHSTVAQFCGLWLTLITLHTGRLHAEFYKYNWEILMG